MRKVLCGYFNVEVSNVRQRRKITVIFNNEFHSVGQRRNNVVKMTISKKKKNHLKLNTLNSKFYILFHNLPLFTPHVKRNMLRNTCKATKILKRS